MQRGSRFGSYSLVERIGHGGMGEVWRARHQLLARQAAIKLIKPDALGVSTDAAGAAMLKRFKREAQATSGLRSPHTIELYDFGLADDGTFYYAMEMLEGLNLQHLVDEYGPIEPARAVFILDQVCDSLAEAHHTGLIHRDIKPPNIYLCRLGLQHDFVKVLDFGLVKHEPREGLEQTVLTADGIAPGSPAYIAPEMANGTSVDARADIYSLGCVAYWLLSGSLVFDADTALDIIVAHVKENPEPLSARTELDVPPELEALVMDCLSKDPAGRPQSARELKSRLAACSFERPWNSDRADEWWARHKPVPVREKDDDDVAEAPAPPNMKARADESAEVDALTSADGSDQLDSMRDAIRSQLQSHFHNKQLDIDELESRLIRLREATNETDLEMVVADLGEPATPVPIVEKPTQALAKNDDTQQALTTPKSTTTLLNIFSGTERSGLWRPPQLLKLINIFGGAKLDLRDAELADGVTEIRCHSVFGGVEIIVPPDLYVDMEGTGFFGAFDQKDAQSSTARPGNKSLLVTGLAIFGGTTIKVKPRK